MGLSWTLRSALLYILPKTDENDVVITMDADNTHDVKCILSMLKCIREGAEVVIASRYIKGGSQVGVSFIRILLSKAVNRAIRLFSGLEVMDTTSGYRCYKASILKKCHKKYECFIASKGFEVQLELLVKINTCTSKIVEIPFILRYNQKHGKSKMQIPNTIINYILLLVKVIVWRIST
jgi:dolichol-phosphate mannosyltransferase